MAANGLSRSSDVPTPPIDGSAEQALARARSTHRRAGWLAALAVLVLLTEQTALGFQLIAPALGGFAAKFGTTQIIWVITMFTLVGGVTTPVVGRLADRYGKRKVLLQTTAISLIGSIVCALAPNFGILLAGRALMGVSAAFIPITYALIRDVFPASWRAMSISIATNGVGAVTIAGPFVAGFLIDDISISAVFWFVGALSAVGALGTIALVPESPIRNRRRIDLLGAVGLAGGMLALLLGISQMQNWGATSVRTSGCIAIAVSVLVAWWLYESHVEEPFVDTSLLRRKSFASVIFAHAFTAGAIVVMASFLPTLLQTPRSLGVDYGFGLDATGVAEFLVIPGVMTVVGGLIVGTLSNRYGFRLFLLLGSVLTAAGAAGLSVLTTEPWMPITMYGLVGLGAMVFAAAPNLMMLLSPAEHRGTAAAMIAAMTAIIGSFFAQIAGLLLTENLSQVVDGRPIYNSHGVFLVFAVASAMAAIGFLIALAVPCEARPNDVVA